TIYTAGRFIADHVFSSTAVSKQCGGMAALKRMIETEKVPLPMPVTPADTGEVAITPFLSFEHGAPPPRSAEPRPYPGHLLKRESRGSDVGAIQSRLFELGINT